MRLILALLLVLVTSLERARRVECFENLFSMGMHYGGLVYKIYRLPSLLIDMLGDEVEKIAVHKCRVAQARYFLGDTFGDRFSEYLKSSYRDPGSTLSSSVDVVDSVPLISGIVDAIANKAVSMSLALQSWILEAVLPKRLSGGAATILTGENFLKFTRAVGPSIAFFTFDMTGTSLILFSVVTFALENRDLVKAIVRESIQVYHVMTKGQLQMEVLATIDPRVEAKVLDEMLSAYPLELNGNTWLARCLKKMTQELPLPAFIDYYAVFVKHFPNRFFGKKSIVPASRSRNGGIASQLILRLSAMIGLFRRRNFKKSFEELVKTLSADLQEYPIDNGTFLVVEYYLDILDVPGSLANPSIVNIESFDVRCALTAILFLPTPQLIKDVVMRGFFGLTALAARYPPPGTLRSDIHGDALVEFAVRHGTPVSLLATLEFAYPPPTLYTLERILSSRAISRVKRLVLQTFLAVRHSKIHAVQPCRRRLFNYKGAFEYHVRVARNFSFLRQVPDMTPEEVKYTALTVAHVMFGVPVHLALAVRHVNDSVEMTVNAMLSSRCRYTEDSLYELVISSSMAVQSQRGPLSSEKLKESYVCNASTLGYSQRESGEPL